MKIGSFREKWENYWYHYKWQTWLGIFLVFLVVFTIGDIKSKNVSDFYITYIGDYMDYEGLSAKISENYSEIIGDENNDGKITGTVKNIYTNPKVPYDRDLDFWNRIDIDIVNGESYIYLIDDYILDAFLKRGVNGVIKTNDGYSSYIDISEHEFFKEYLPKDRKVYLLVRKQFEKPDEKVKKAEDKSIIILEEIF